MRFERKKVLIVDDSTINRRILADILSAEYQIIEAKDGESAILCLRSFGDELSLVLLDIVMPEVDGFAVLEEMKKNGWIEKIPVITISSESSADNIDRAYSLGVTDFISKPFDTLVVKHRVANTIKLYDKQRSLIQMVEAQIEEKMRISNLMIAILSHIVEFRNGESGAHVLRIHAITEMLTMALDQTEVGCKLTNEDIYLISTAATLHDIGKMAIPDEILNKPGKLTEEEFSVMKTHSSIGARMLEDIPFSKDEKLTKIAYEICRWHHERFDGRGYPDGLSGEKIPLTAQIVSLADVYDALTSPRVYKEAYSHQKAIEMILAGECGKFHPALIKALLKIEKKLEFGLTNDVMVVEGSEILHKAVEEMMNGANY